MKKIKRILFIAICLLAICSFIHINKVQATTSDNGNGNWTPEKSEEIDVLGMSHSSIWGTANGTNPQHINLLTMKTDGASSKLVTWSCTVENKKYTRATLDVVAKDYEKTHPGWIVVGGINADQYTTGFGSDIGAGSSYFSPQTYYPLIMDGESRIPITVTNITSMQVGFANDGSSNSLVPSSTIRSYVLTIVDEYKNEIAKFDIDKINQSPSNGETSVWSTYISISNQNKYVEQNIETTNKVYVVENPELAYMSNTVNYNNGSDSLFGKGTISKVTTSVTLRSNQFAIETTNDEIIKALDEGVRIIVDAEWDSVALNQVEASTGYHSVHRMNGVDQPLVHTSYDGNRYSRAIVGKKADGTYVLLTVDVANDPNDLTIRYAGMGFDECNAVLKHYGVVEAYQMDGGGSVTSMYRDENGEFVISNYCREGVRENMTSLLFVVRDPQTDVVDTTYHSVTFEKTLNPGIKSTIENVKILVNNEEYSLQNNKVTIDNLEENTEYQYEIIYNVVQDGVSKQMSITRKFKTTSYQGISPKFEIKDISKKSFKVVMEENETIKNVQVVVNETPYNLENNEAQITNLISDVEYPVTYIYDIYDEVTKNLYHREMTGPVVRTSLYEIPSITEFYVQKELKNKVNLKYTYSDEDELVTKAVLLCNNQQIELTSRTGTKQISDVDLQNNSYTAKIVLTYVIDEAEYTVEKELTFGTGSQAGVKHNINYELDGGTLPSSAVTTYVEGTGLEKLPTPTKDGYKFDGWYDENDNKVTSISKTEKSDITLHAKWTENNGGNGCSFGTSFHYLITLTSALASIMLLLRKRK